MSCVMSKDALSIKLAKRKAFSNALIVLQQGIIEGMHSN